MNKSARSLVVSIVALGLSAAIALLLSPDSPVENSPEMTEDESFMHRLVNDKLSVTFDESVTASQAVILAKQAGYDIVESSFTDVIVKAELAKGWSEKTIDVIEALPEVVKVRVVSWETAAQAATKDTPPAYGICYVKSRKRELVFIHFRNGTTTREIRSNCERLGHVKILAIADSPNSLVLSCSQRKMKEAMSLFEKNANVRHVAFLSELVAY